jgi:hypothetical protein
MLENTILLIGALLRCLRVENPPVGARAVALVEIPALALALPLRFFETLGVPRLAAR